MSYTIKNLTNSPYKVGEIEIPARGEVVAELNAADLSAIKVTGYFVVTEQAEEQIVEKKSRKPKD